VPREAIGYVQKALGHYVENTDNTDLIYMEVFRADRFVQFPKNRPDIVPA
jgi:oxalate decarboxylase/phosphoglucose isomerase-like protein (cupin superfamily)